MLDVIGGLYYLELTSNSLDQPIAVQSLGYDNPNPDDIQNLIADYAFSTHLAPS